MKGKSFGSLLKKCESIRNSFLSRAEMFTALMAASASSRENEQDLLQCVNLLLDFGAKADVCERHRMTPLMFACKEGRADIAHRLVQAKVDANKQDNKGYFEFMFVVIFFAA